MKLIKEHIDFERGRDPKDVLNVGIKPQIEKMIYQAHDIDGDECLIMYSIESINIEEEDSVKYFIVDQSFKSTEGKEWIENVLQKAGLFQFLLPSTDLKYKIKPEVAHLFDIGKYGNHWYNNFYKYQKHGFS